MSTQSRSPRRAAARWARRALAGAAALALAGAALQQALAQDLLGLKNSLVQFALRQVSVEGAFEISAGGVREPRDGVTEIFDLAIADGDGVWFRAEALAVRWNPARILRGELEITELTVRDATMSRAATPPELRVRDGAEIAQGAERGLFDWPRAPISVRVERVEITRAAIAAGALFEQAISFNARGSARDEGPLQALALELDRTDAVAGRIHFDYRRDFEADTLALRLEAAEAAGGLAAELLSMPAYTPSEISLTADGPLSDWALSLRATAKDLISAEAEATLQAQPLEISAEARLRPGPRLAEPAALALGAEARLTLAAREAEGVVRITEAALASPAVEITAAGRYARADGATALSLAATARPPMAALIEGVDFGRIVFTGELTGALGASPALEARGGARVEALSSAAADIGTARLDVSAEIAGAGAELRAEIRGEGGAEGVRLDRLTPELLGAGRLSFDLGVAGGAAELRAAAFESPLFSASLSGAVEPGADRVDLAYAARAPRLAPIAAAYGLDAAGAAEAEGALAGPLAGPALRGAARIAGLTVAGRRLGDAALEHEATLGAAAGGALRARLTGGPARVEAGARVSRAPAGARLEALRVAVGGAVLRGAATVAAGSGLIDGAATLEAPDLAALAPLLGAPLSGALSAELRMSGAGGAQTAEAQARARDLALGDMRLAEARIEAAARDLFGAPRAELTLAAEDLAAGAARVARVDASAALSPERLRTEIESVGAAFGALTLPRATLRAEGPRDAVDLTLTAAGALRGRGPVSARAAARLDLSETMRARVETLELALGADRFALSRPLEIDAGGGATRLRGLALAAPGGALTGEAALYADGVSGRLALALDDVRPLSRLAALELEAGALDLDARFDTRPGRAGAEVAAEARGLKLAPDAEDPIALDAEATWDGRRVALTAEASGPFGAPLTVAAATALRARRGLAPAPPPGAQVDGRLTWRGRVERLWELAPFPDHVLAGEIDADLRLQGPLDAPRVAGRLSMRDGSYQHLETGTLLTDLAADTRVVGADAVEVMITGEDGSGAPVSASASLRDGRVRATLSATDALLARRDDVTAAATVALEVAGPAARPDVSGSIEITRAEIRLLAPPPALADIGEVRFEGDPPPPVRAATAGGGGRLDIALTAPGGVFVRGRGLDSEWGAELALGGTTDRPRIDGRVESRRGALSFIGQTFDLTQGRVRFAGAAPPDPDLDIRFERRRDDLTGRIEIGGRASAPSVRFASEPALPEGEVLPRILFGRSAGALTPAQGLQLANGVATLLSGDEGLTGRLRAAAGLDFLTFEGEGTSGAVRAGRSLREDVFIGVAQPIDGGAPSVSVEVEVLDSVTVDSEVSGEGGVSAGVNWRVDF